MDTEQVLKSGEALLQPWIKETTQPEGHRINVLVDSKDLLPAVKALVDNRWGYLSTITAMDMPAYKEVDGVKTAVEDGSQIELLYHFSEGAAVLSIKVLVSYQHPVVDSICGLIPSASLYEREVMEMLGVDITNTPDRSKLLLPDQWPDGVYPLRKSFTGLKREEKA